MMAGTEGTSYLVLFMFTIQLAIIGADITGPGANVCEREVLETGYYYVNSSYTCWETNYYSDCRAYCDRYWCRRHTYCPVSSTYICYVEERLCGPHLVTEYYCCPGYEENGNTGKCVGSDGCTSDNGGCDQVCQSTSSGVTCSCYPGYQFQGYICVDVNECRNNNGGCDGQCQNTEGSFYCTCPQGYQLTDPTTCQDIDECAMMNGGCQDICINTEGDSYCECQEGYEVFEGFSCIDVDECETYNGGCSHRCVNTRGGRVCLCPHEGFTLVDDTTCVGDFDYYSSSDTFGPGGGLYPGGPGGEDGVLGGGRPAAQGGEDARPEAAIAGGVVGGLSMVAFVVLVLVICRRRKGTPKKTAASGGLAIDNASYNPDHVTPQDNAYAICEVAPTSKVNAGGQGRTSMIPYYDVSSGIYLEPSAPPDPETGSNTGHITVAAYKVDVLAKLRTVAKNKKVMKPVSPSASNTTDNGSSTGRNPAVSTPSPKMDNIPTSIPKSSPPPLPVKKDGDSTKGLISNPPLPPPQKNKPQFSRPTPGAATNLPQLNNQVHTGAAPSTSVLPPSTKGGLASGTTKAPPPTPPPKLNKKQPSNTANNISSAGLKSERGDQSQPRLSQILSIKNNLRKTNKT